MSRACHFRKSQIMEKIRRAFKEYFDEFDIELPETIQVKGSIQEGGWSITYILNTDEDGKPALDFFAEHRMTNPQLVRIHADGRVEEVASIQETYSFDPDKKGDGERAQKEFQEHNDKVAKLLKERGFL